MEIYNEDEEEVKLSKTHSRMLEYVVSVISDTEIVHH